MKCCSPKDLLLFIPCALLLAATGNLQATESSLQPPALEPFEDLDKPTEQTTDIKDLLSFLPEVLATYGENSRLTKTELVDEMGMGLQIAAQQGKKFSDKELIKIITQLVDSMINLKFMTELASKDGFYPKIDKAKDEVSGLRSQYGKEGFESLLKMQGISEGRLQERLGRKIMIDDWIENSVSKSQKITLKAINKFYEKNKDTFQRPLDEVLIEEIEEKLIQDGIAKYLKSKFTDWKTENRLHYFF